MSEASKINIDPYIPAKKHGNSNNMKFTTLYLPNGPNCFKIVSKSMKVCSLDIFTS